MPDLVAVQGPVVVATEVKLFVARLLEGFVALVTVRRVLALLASFLCLIYLCLDDWLTT